MKNCLLRKAREIIRLAAGNKTFAIGLFKANDKSFLISNWPQVTSLQTKNVALISDQGPFYFFSFGMLHLLSSFCIMAIVGLQFCTSIAISPFLIVIK